MLNTYGTLNHQIPTSKYTEPKRKHSYPYIYPCACVPLSSMIILIDGKT